MPDLTPAPGSTATSAPSPIIFLTVSGVAATRGSDWIGFSGNCDFHNASNGRPLSWRALEARVAGSPTAQVRK